MNTVLALAGVVVKELYRRKDFYVLFVLTALITLVVGAVNFFHDPRIIRFLKEVCLLLIWASTLVVAIGTAARQIPAERENRTIFPLLAKPVTRWQVLFGKFLGCWLACGIALLVFYLFFAVVIEARGHQDGSATGPAAAATTSHVSEKPAHDPHAGHEDEHHHEPEGESAGWVGFNYIQALWLHWSMLGVVIAMVLLGSVVFAAPSSNATIIFICVAGILFLGEHLNKIAQRQGQPVQTLLQVIYFSIPHLEWYDIRSSLIYGRAPLAWGVCGLATLYAAAYTALFLFLTWLVFRRKSLTA